ncbi:RNA polymerase sigma factor [Pedobacter agri]|uniref:RNA polymerase sigma factor n=1 Tax=Pedobacter agri TaxID=454586 RepID=UPI00292F8C54|nr:RNA polymerase sigma factor [Pedobacter agri]
MKLEEFSNRIYRNSEQMRQFSIKLTRNSVDADDLLQQTFLRAYTYRHHYDPSADVKHWLLRIMKNQFINDFRYQAKRNTSLISIEHLDTSAITNLTTNHRADSDLFIQEIHAAVNSLAPIYRLPLTYYVQGFKYAEIAETLGLTLGTVKRRIFEARKMLGKNGINSNGLK